jgi:apolipoprotein N-acyltransferase
MPQDSKKMLVFAAAILFTITGYSLIRYQMTGRDIATAPTAVIGIVQGNIAQDEKWVPSFQARTIDTYISLSEALLTQNQAELLIWPETALPFYPMENQLFQAIRDRLITRHRVPLLTGAPHREGLQANARYYNSSFLIDADGSLLARYDKQHLVPFGEYIPLRIFMPSSIVPIVETMGDFTPGSSTLPIKFGNLQLGILICYESIFPELARLETSAGANLLVNLTNDAWYGRSSAPWQQLSMAVFRAVETKRSLARAANTGISVFIDPLGRTHNLSPLFAPFQAAAHLALLTEKTFFCRIGYLFPLFCLIGFLAVVVVVKQKK